MARGILFIRWLRTKPGTLVVRVARVAPNGDLSTTPTTFQGFLRRCRRSGFSKLQAVLDRLRRRYSPLALVLTGRGDSGTFVTRYAALYMPLLQLGLQNGALPTRLVAYDAPAPMLLPPAQFTPGWGRRPNTYTEYGLREGDGLLGRLARAAPLWLVATRNATVRGRNKEAWRRAAPSAWKLVLTTTRAWLGGPGHTRPSGGRL